MTARVLITGGFGNLGGRIAKAFSANGSVVRLASRGSHTSPRWLPSAEVAAIDYANTKSMNQALECVDLVVHLGSPDEQACTQFPENALRETVEGTRNLIFASIEMGVRRFIYLSTAHIYGRPLTGDIDELTHPQPEGVYALSRLHSETVVSAVHESRELIGVVLRCANGFGFPMHQDVNSWHLLVNDLCRQGVMNNELRLNSSGEQYRNFIPIEDICGAINHVVSLPESIIDNGIFNLGGPKSLTVYEMATLVAKRCEVKLGRLPPVHCGSSAGKPAKVLNFDTRKIRLTGYRDLSDFSYEIDGIIDLCSSSSSAL